MYVAAGGSRLLGRVDTARLTFAHPHISEGVATWLGCPALQGTVQEVLDPAHVLQLVESVGDISLAQVRGGCNYIQQLVGWLKNGVVAIVGWEEVLDPAHVLPPIKSVGDISLALCAEVVCEERHRPRNM